MLLINIFVILFFSLFLLKNNWNEVLITTKTIDSLQKDIIYSLNSNSGITVQIVAEDNQSYYQEWSDSSFVEKQDVLKKWSGIIASKSWYIITNKHVVDDINLKYSIVTNDGIVLPVKKIRNDDLIDIAILYIENNTYNLSEARFVDINATINIGQFVFAIWNPLSEYPNTVSMGIISGKWRKINIEGKNNLYYAWLYQTDAALNPWNSWWPLINLSGEVIAMVTAISRWGNNLWFALPLNKSIINTTVEILKYNDTLIRPYVWIFYADTLSWAKIDTILPNSPVQWQILVWDFIIEVDNRKISAATPFLYYLYTYKPGDTIVLKVIRDNNMVSVPIVLWQKTL